MAAHISLRAAPRQRPPGRRTTGLPPFRGAEGAPAALMPGDPAPAPGPRWRANEGTGPMFSHPTANDSQRSAPVPAVPAA